MTWLVYHYVTFSFSLQLATTTLNYKLITKNIDYNDALPNKLNYIFFDYLGA